MLFFSSIPAEAEATPEARDQSDSTVSFHVSRVGTPVEVKVSYFPNWQAHGADGPWRIAPNLMVVVPTSHDVSLVYASSASDKVGELISLLSLLGVVALFIIGRRARRSRRATSPGPAP